jgi:hypothetical protein
MRLVDYFDRIYVLFLPQRTDRITHMKRQLLRLGLEKQAIWFSGLSYSDPAGFPNAGVRGCVMSHYTILKQASEAGVEKLLLLQDDCTFSRYLIKNEPVLMEKLAITAWDFAYLGHGEKVQQNKTHFTRAKSDQPVMLTHCCSYSQQAIPRLIQLIEDSLERVPGHPDGGPMYFDGYMNTLRAGNPDIVTLLATPSLAWQHSSPSNLGSATLDRYSQLAPIIRVARLAKSAIQSIS